MKNAPLSSRTLSCLSERREEKKLSPDERRVSRDVANTSCEVRVEVCGEVSVRDVCGGMSVEGHVWRGVCGIQLAMWNGEVGLIGLWGNLLHAN